MKKINKKRIIASLLVCFMMVGATGVVFAASKSYNTTYDMQKRVFSRSYYMDKKGTMKAVVTPSIGNGVKVGIQMAQGSGWGQYGDMKSTTTSSKTASFKTSNAGEFRFMFYSKGGRAKGKLALSWNW